MTVGLVNIHSHNSNSPGANSVQGYRNPLVVGAATVVTYIPLGYAAGLNEVRPMALLDKAAFSTVLAPEGAFTITEPNGYYLLEY